ncbi:uncharacterized protein ACA1_378610 [Acanthamoeba castellanii str. Neff]|uniref:DDE Tnp4 domain-containing protein n=1 Tax=Acanthamoeba castellanii (strain ATCC 30010 / Neff) TaxID=1257118 RepID=L8GUC8_ACACF|nr:uncharacterized protein ACA1_378610 [Acanthamoeba castellanii str. Neff]ELR15711.1 hypothetical protein ACA1_378610 [Acanthamoeba castellanii str. Neff]
MQGKLCVICNQTQSGTNLPYPHVQIGKFHSFMLCCKAHLISSINVKKFEELIDHELDNLKKNGDWMVDELVEGLQPEEEEELEATPMCHSVLNLRDSNALLTCCTNLMSQHLWIHHHSNSNCILYFCKGSHLVRYLFSKFNKQGRKPGQELLAKKQRTTAAEKKAAVAEKKAAGKKVVGQKAVGKKVGVKGKTAPKAKKATKKGSNMDNTTPEAKADGETKGDNDDDHNAEGEEQPAHSSNHAVADSKLYSAKKGQHSVTLLVLVTLDGTILWLGRSQGGSTTNLALAHAELNTWLSQFDCDEHGIADASFNVGGGRWAVGGRRQAAGGRQRAAGGVDDRLLTPPPYIEETRAAYREFSRVRIVVEQSIGRVKNWAAARETLRLPTSRRDELYAFHHKVWTIISVLVNKYQRISHMWDE